VWIQGCQRLLNLRRTGNAGDVLPEFPEIVLVGRALACLLDNDGFQQLLHRLLAVKGHVPVVGRRHRIAHGATVCLGVFQPGPNVRLVVHNSGLRVCHSVACS